MAEVLITVGLTMWVVALLIWAIYKIAHDDVLMGVVVALAYLGLGLFIVVRTDLSWQAYLIPGLAVPILVSLLYSIKDQMFVYGLPAIVSACGATWLWFNVEGPGRAVVLVVTLGVIGAVLFVGLAELWTKVLRDMVEERAKDFVLGAVRGLKEDIGKVAEKQDNVEADVKTLAERTQGIEAQCKSVDDEIVQLKGQVESLAREVQRLKNHFHPTLLSSYYTSGSTFKEDTIVTGPPKIVLTRLFLRPSSSDSADDFGPVIVQRRSFAARTEEPVPLDRLQRKPEADIEWRREFVRAFSEYLAKELIDPLWEEVTTEYWSAPADQELEQFLNTMKEQHHQWHRLVLGDRVEEFAEWVGFTDTSIAADIATEVDLPFDRPYRTGRLLVESIGMVADVATGGVSSLLTSACVQSLAYDTTAHVVAKQIEKALVEMMLHPVGAMSGDIRQVGRDRAVAREPKQSLRKDSLGTRTPDPSREHDVAFRDKALDLTEQPYQVTDGPRSDEPDGVGGGPAPKSLVEPEIPRDLLITYVPGDIVKPFPGESNDRGDDDDLGRPSRGDPNKRPQGLKARGSSGRAQASGRADERTRRTDRPGREV